MKKLLIALTILAACAAGLGSEIVKNDTTSKSLYFMIYGPTGEPNSGLTETGFDLYYVTEGNSVATKIDCTELAGENTAYTSGGCKEMGSLGLYRVDVPNAALRAGIGKDVTFILDYATSTNIYDRSSLTIQLSPSVDVNTVGGRTPIASSDITAAVPTVAQIEAVIEPNLNLAKTYALAAQTAAEKIDTATELRTLLTGGNFELATEPNLSAAFIATGVWGATAATYDSEDTFGNIINDMVEESAGTYRFTEATLAESASATGVWSELIHGKMASEWLYGAGSKR